MANDWHSSLVCVYVASKYRPYGVYKDARTVLCIHNMAHHVRLLPPHPLRCARLAVSTFCVGTVYQGSTRTLSPC